jgi:hypothetical protein
LGLSGADDEVKTLRNGFDERGNLIRVVLGISIKENEGVWISLLCLGQYALDGCAFASIFGMADYGGTGKRGNLPM